MNKKVVLPIFFNNLEDYESQDILEQLGISQPEAESESKEFDIRDVAFYHIDCVLPQPHKGEIKGLIASGTMQVLSPLSYEETVASIDKQRGN